MTLMPHDNPFLSLRVAFGMLLGEDDFNVMMGHPRGKHMLHSAWLHGAGVLWGYGVKRVGGRLDVSPGLAADALGRELRLEVTTPVDVHARIRDDDFRKLYEGDDPAPEVPAHLVAELRLCPTAPVPTPADPCDVTREHDDFSRMLETAVIRLIPGPAPAAEPLYPRLYALAGLHELDPDSDAGQDVAAALEAIAGAGRDGRAAAYLTQFRRLAAADAAGRGPAEDDAGPTLYPALPETAGVVLAGVTVVIRKGADCTEVEQVTVDPSCRATLLPTATIQELLTGAAPRLLGPEERDEDAGGPRIRLDPPPAWSPDGRTLTLEVTGRLNPRTVRGAVAVTSLSPDGWDREDVDAVGYSDHPRPRITVRLDEPPDDDRDRIRVIVRGTGSRPVFGAGPDGLPLAGVEGGPPGGAVTGRDAVLMLDNPTARSDR